MLFNYLKIAYRSFFKNKISSFVNLIGLTVGIAACMLILQYVGMETSYDTFHEDRDRLYRLSLLEGIGTSKEDRSATNYYAVAETLTERIPEIESFCTIHGGSGVVRYQDKSFREEKVFYVDPNFFEFFSFPVISGDRSTMLDDPKKIVITDQIARKYFGNEDPLGKNLLMNGKDLYQVSGVTQSPVNSHFTFDFIRSNKNLLIDPYGKYDGLWNWSNFYAYMKLQKNSSPEEVETKFASVLSERHEPDDPDWQHILVPVDEIYLYSDLNWEMGPTGQGKVVFTLLIIAILILVIAWVNMINLSTAHASERAKEVGIRKVSGATRGQLILQFLLQAFFLNLLALALAMIICHVIKPYFQSFIGQNIQNIWDMSGIHTLLFIGVFVIGVIGSGIYPALVLSGFKPIRTLKGKFHNSFSGILLRKSLSVFQFSATIILIACSMMVFKQLNFMRQQNLGFDPDQTLVIEGPRVIDSTFEQRAQAFKTEIKSLAAINGVTTSSSIPSREVSGSWNGFRKENESESNGILMDVVYVDQDFIPTFDLKIAKGRNFSDDFKQEENSIILNETGMKALGYGDIEEAVNKFIRVGSGENKFQIIGILEDYHHKSLKENINPLCVFYTKTADSYFSLKMSDHDYEKNIASAKAVFTQFFPNDPFDFFFLDQSFNNQYTADKKLGRIITLFSSLAILIACLGLFGLTAYAAIKRAKEIGIRKVLGAKISDILLLIAREFIGTILLSILIAIPLAYLIINRWLENYAYRAPIEWWVFLLAGMTAALVAVVTMSYQGFRSATTNPVNTLKDE